MSLQLLKMVLNQKRIICFRSLHIKFGVALAISAGGILSAFLALRRSCNRSGKNVDNNNRGSNSSGNENKSDSRGENGDGELKQPDLALLDSTIRRVLSNSSLTDRSSFGSRDGLLLPEFNEVLQECNMALITASISPRRSNGHGTEDIHNSDDSLYDLKIESLVSHNRRLETKLGDYGSLMAELEAEKSKTKILRRKLRAGADQAVEEILTPRIQTDHDLINRKGLEEHLEEMMKSNRALKQENSELLHKLEYVQMLATTALETEEMHELRVESQRLRQQNDELTKEVERIQGERWSDIEELVYLRWINACLRYEVRNHKTGGGKSIPGKMLSPKSEDRVKQIIMESAYNKDAGFMITDLDSENCSSSHSYLTDDSSFDTSHVAEKPTRSSKNKVFSKLRKLLKGKSSSSSSRNNSQEAAAVKKSNNLGRTMSLINIPDGYSSYSDELLIKSSMPSSRGSSRRSLDLPRSCSRSQKSMSSNGSVRMSDVSSSILTRINSLTEADEQQWPLELPAQDAKEELLKYAETLKNSRESFRKKSAVFES